MSAPAEKKRPVPVSTMAFTPGSALASLKAFSSPTRRAWPSALTGGLSMRMTATSPCFCVSTTATMDAPLSPAQFPGKCRHLAWRRLTGEVTLSQRCIPGRYADAARAHDGSAAAGLERDRLRGRGLPFRAGGLPDRGRRAAPLRLRGGQGAHRPARQCPGRPRHQARRPGGDAGLERLPPFRALLCDLRHRRRLPHHQPAAVPRADRLHRQPCRATRRCSSI